MIMKFNDYNEEFLKIAVAFTTRREGAKMNSLVHQLYDEYLYKKILQLFLRKIIFKSKLKHTRILAAID